MSKHHVYYTHEDEGGIAQVFTCQADNEDHAREQCLDAEPKAVVQAVFGGQDSASTLALTPQELNTVLAALRFYQEHDQGDPARRSDRIHEIATGCGENVSLDDQGIDDLCDKLCWSEDGCFGDGLSDFPVYDADV